MRSEPLTLSARARSRLVAPGSDASASRTRALSRTGALLRAPFFGGLLRGFGCFPLGCFLFGSFCFRFGFELFLGFGGFRLLCRLLFLAAAFGRPLGDQRRCLFERDRLRIVAGGNGGVGRAVGHIGTVATLHDLYGFAADGVRTKLPERFGTAPFEALGLALGNQRDRVVETDSEHVFRRFQRGILLFVLNVRPIAAEIRNNRLSGLGMLADLARQREQ